MLRGFVLGVVVALIGVGLIAFGLISTGEIPINADAKPGGFELWAANTDLTAALKRMAPKTANPVALTDANLIEGVRLYGRHCALCHGTSAGDASRSPIAMGEYPSPPQFGTDGVEDDPEGVTFWKLQHGIRLTGMPSWRQTLSERQMWTLALLLKHMDKLPPAAEAQWKALGSRPSGPPPSGPGAAADRADDPA